MAITPLRDEYKLRDRSSFTTEFRKKFAVTLPKGKITQSMMFTVDSKP